MLSEDEIARAVTLRMTRQEILRRDEPPRLWVIIDESVLRREVGGKDAMRAQCERLLEVGQWPHVAIQVVLMPTGRRVRMGRTS
jgi:hypothetical protein